MRGRTENSLFSYKGFIRHVKEDKKIRRLKRDYGIFFEDAVAYFLRRRMCSTFPTTVFSEVTSFLETQVKNSESTSSKKWKILDPSAGWGDRMVSAWKIADRVDYYIGLDPSPHLPALYGQIFETALSLFPGLKKEVGDLHLQDQPGVN